MPKRNRRRLPPFRPLPIDLRRRRRGMAPRQYARAYERYESKTGRVKRQSFSVKVDPDKNPIVQYKLMRHLSNKLKRGLIPLVPQGTMFDDFGDLFIGTRWIKVKKVLSYKVGMEYVR
jgi:hypothetical protein